MQSFLIEFRLHGYAKHYAKSLAKEVSESFNLKSDHRVVPHITLYGPSTTNDIKHVISIVQTIGQKYKLVPFTIKGFSYFRENRNVIYLDIDPSPELKSLRWELSKALQRISTCQTWDKDQEFEFHSTIALGIPDDKFNQVLTYIQGKKVPNIQQHLLRITILGHKRKIVCEDDLVLRKRLNRRQALSRYWWRRTIKKYRDLRPSKIEDAWESIYFIGDLHLGHRNIIKYCNRRYRNRRFRDADEMDSVLIGNWRHSIRDNDTVYFLGDVPGPQKDLTWLPKYLPKLTGKMTWIRGNHDKDVPDLPEYNIQPYETLEFDKYKFLMIHDPTKDLPIEWDGWIIHGHKHNNDIKNYPFINGEKKTINVSVEVIDYKPVSLDHLLRLDIDSIQRMDTIKSKPIKWEH